MMKFADSIKDTNWETVINCSCPQVAFSLFHEEFTHVYDACFPLKNYKVNYKNREV